VIGDSVSLDFRFRLTNCPHLLTIRVELYHNCCGRSTCEEIVTGSVLQTPKGQYQYEYERPSVTVDIILFTFQDDQLRVLLVRRAQQPYAGKWALPGGFVQMNEDLDEAARRELSEETNVSDIYLEQLYTFGEPDRDPRTRVITVAYFALLGTDQVGELQIHGATDVDDARWWNLYSLPELAFDHDRIIQYGLQRLRWKLQWTALGFLLLPEEFTLSELQRVYETVLHEPLDKRNFRRKMLAADVLEETGNLREGDHRPAKLYRFTAKAIELEQARRRFP
jgi:8-oxo-dGTP diphosphatase